MALIARTHYIRGQYCYNTEEDKNSVVSQASCRMDVIRLQVEMSKFTHDEAGGIQRLPHRWLQTVNALGDYFEVQGVCMCPVFFKLLARVMITDK